MLKTQHTHSQQHQPTHTHIHTQQLAQHSLTLSHTDACARWASFFHLMSKPLVFERLCKKESGQNFHLHTWCVFFFSFILNIISNFFYYFLLWTLITRHFQHRFKLMGKFWSLTISPRTNVEFWANLWINFLNIYKRALSLCTHNTRDVVPSLVGIELNANKYTTA